MKNKIFNRLSSLVVIAAMLMGFTVSVSAGNDGLIGANIKDGQLLGYFGDGGDIKIPDTVNHHPRPWRCGQYRGPGGRHVCRRHRGDRHLGRNLLRPPPPLHLGPAVQYAPDGH